MNPFRGRAFGLFAFDLDGTLIDSIEDIAASLNAVRAAHSLPPLPEAAVRGAVGAGARALLERTTAAELPADVGVDALYPELLAAYRVYCARDPRLYPGAREFLIRADASGVRLAIVTNKPLEIAMLTLRAAALDPLFTRIMAPENAPRKPDPSGLLALLEELAVGRDAAVLFGDSAADFATGSAAGVTTIGLRGGYDTPGGPEPDVWADDWAMVRGWWDSRGA